MPPDDLSLLLQAWREDPAGPPEHPGRNADRLHSGVLDMAMRLAPRVGFLHRIPALDMDDIAQVTAIRVVASLPRIESNLAGVIYRALGRNCISWLRRQTDDADDWGADEGHRIGAVPGIAAADCAPSPDAGTALRCLERLEQLVVSLGREDPKVFIRAQATLWFIFRESSGETEVDVQEFMDALPDVTRDVAYTRRRRGIEWFRETVVPLYYEMHPDCMRVVEELAGPRALRRNPREG